MKTWIFAHPVWSTVIAVAIIAGIILLIRALTKDAPQTPAEPANPNPENPRRNIIVNPNVNINTGGRPSGMGGGVGTGGVGARVGQNVSR